MDQARQQELYMRASYLEKSSEEAQQQIEFLTRELEELAAFDEYLNALANTAGGTESFSAMGKGLYVKTNVSDSNVYVDVGAGVLVKKTPLETKKVISLQMEKLEQARTHLLERVSSFTQELRMLLSTFESEGAHTH